MESRQKRKKTSLFCLLTLCMQWAMSERGRGCIIFCPRVWLRHETFCLTDSESHPRPSPDPINSDTCLILRTGAPGAGGAASRSAITRHDYPETGGGGHIGYTMCRVLTYIRGGGYHQHVSPVSPHQCQCHCSLSALDC